MASQNSATEERDSMESNVNLVIRDALLRGVDSPNHVADDDFMAFIAEVEALNADEEAQQDESEAVR